MIIRQFTLRQGRCVIRRNAARQWKRCLASPADSIHQSLQNQLQETRAIESEVNQYSIHHVQTIDAETHAPVETDSIAEDFQELLRQQKVTGSLGTEVAKHYQPHTLISNPPRPSDVTLELLLASQAHLGHNTSLWNPANARYIFGVHDGIHIISLDVTAAYLRRAAKVVSAVAERGGLILFVGTRNGQDRCVVRAAGLAGGCHLFERWTPGSITNGLQILGKCRLKVVNEFDEEIPGFDSQLADRPPLKPDLVVCLNPLENYIMLHECGLNNIPTIGIIDTDANPTWVTYPIPANDDSLRCVQVIAGVLGRAGQEGQAARREAAARNHITYAPAENLKAPQRDTRSKENGDVHADALDAEARQVSRHT
ncbi:ribosomal protein S2 [Viridothelium virens]|uniref:Ribosomal protein S2 n=1 Tax=Viridothelium virens TaxID=1048519 RepID=A0A6A6HHA5_VIRVR|nr:ribosomal protein S2 [Viridothelium virens]